MAPDETAAAMLNMLALFGLVFVVIMGAEDPNRGQKNTAHALCILSRIESMRRWLVL